jgi:hypothetical protein
MTALSAALLTHAATLLAGTSLPAADAARVAGDPAAPVPSEAAAAAHALRDGWAAAAHPRAAAS